MPRTAILDLFRNPRSLKELGNGNQIFPLWDTIFYHRTLPAVYHSKQKNAGRCVLYTRSSMPPMFREIRYK